jgi:apolipoprotein N-acyltransferase
MRAKHAGALLGLAFGWLVVQYNIYIAVFLAVCAGVGWVVGRVVDGETDVVELLRRRGPGGFD